MQTNNTVDENMTPAASKVIMNVGDYQNSKEFKEITIEKKQ